MMTTGKPLLVALAGEVVRPAPVWLMRQAGRYLPEYRALRAREPDFLRFCLTPKLATEVTLQPIRRFGLDGAILFSDILVPPFALGHGVRFVEGEGPVLERVTSRAQVEALDLSRARGVWAPVMETVRRLRGALPPGVTLIGFAGAPFTVAAYMVEGGGSRDFAEARRMAFAEPGLFGALVARLEEATIDYLSAQVEAGAEALMLFDSWAGVLSPAQFRRWVIEPTARIAAALRARFPAVPLIGFPRGAGPMLGDYAEGTGAQAVGLDTALPAAWAARILPAGVTGQGNLDPMALVAGGAALAEEVATLMRAVAGRPWVVNLGHGIVPQTPPEHVAELVALVRAAS
ncbi:uroporphyrinogen decarboxylase [Elioraea sp. Yellowstone]|uniref:uroporphyrinogen decarboxylase n=1 Tax=Elioraea sp. Yellowstone TaxID=2592070 RepID=UPI00115401A6|nr:uroporphyrinogen decarboxylase [Elioraea sp. Yellowstone]TQF78971.1 uroporphyrinogen decarboxylase [Elioraea sp. Yellowstone]